MKDNTKILNAFRRPFLSRIPLRLVTGVIVATLISNLVEGGLDHAVQDIYFWIIAVPSVYFFVRSFLVGLRYKNGIFVYRTYFRKKRFTAEQVDFFQIVDSDDDWADIVVGVLSELFTVPGVHLKNGEKISFRACAGLMWSVDKKLVHMNRIMNPAWSTPTDLDRPGVSNWTIWKMFASDFRQRDSPRTKKTPQSGQGGEPQ